MLGERGFRCESRGVGEWWRGDWHVVFLVGSGFGVFTGLSRVEW